MSDQYVLPIFSNKEESITSETDSAKSSSSNEESDYKELTNFIKNDKKLVEEKIIGIRHEVKLDEPFIKKSQLIYSHRNGDLYFGDSIIWLKTLQTNSVDLVFADPPYNISKADWDKFESHVEYVRWSLKWIKEAARVLKPSGTLYICGFSEILADLKLPSMKYFKSIKWIIWHYKNKANLGNDWGRSHESILCLRKDKNFTFNVDDVRIPYGDHTLKYPSHPQAETSQYGNKGKRKDVWEPHPLGAKPKDVIEIPTTCNGSGETTPHPTQKPEELIRRFILASSSEGDLVIDPFLGSGTTAVVAEQLDRKWKGCDSNYEYFNWSIMRIENVIRKSKQEWIKFDKDNTYRRGKIR